MFKIGFRYIDVLHDWSKYEIKIATISEIEEFLNVYKSMNSNVRNNFNSNENITFSDEQNEVIQICKNK